ncbi:SAM-dependent methyltransferase [Cryptosporangium sp. NPDC051539]|uniref:SAM-dependent methyltransferase n=1 Tax=Cryptosporangium sp. NPDC051539 TaxID=3363962 RepID=UPI00379E818B
MLVHARALLSSSPEGATAYLDADFHEPEAILRDPDLQRVLDLSQPVGLMLIAILHFMKDADHPYENVARLVDALPAGSHLTVTNATLDFAPPQDAADARAMLGHEMEWRTTADVERFYDGMTLVEPGVVPVSEWRPEETERPEPAQVSSYGAMGFE